MDSHTKLKSVSFFVEATTKEQHYIWKQYYNEYDWKEDSHGYYIMVGCIGNNEQYPVYISVNFCEIEGKTICFYYTSGRYSDSELILEFFKKNYPIKYDNGNRWSMTDSTNFHVVFSIIKK